MQGVVFTRILEEDAYSIQCSYLSGSDVSGCVYVLVSREEGVENVTGFIERDSNGVTLEVANIGCYSEVLAYDDNSINEIIPVRTGINHSEFEACIITTGKAIKHFLPNQYTSAAVRALLNSALMSLYNATDRIGGYTIILLL